VSVGCNALPQVQPPLQRGCLGVMTVRSHSAYRTLSAGAASASRKARAFATPTTLATAANSAS
jgi:hypothetical protein